MSVHIVDHQAAIPYIPMRTAASSGFADALRGADRIVRLAVAHFGADAPAMILFGENGAEIVASAGDAKQELAALPAGGGKLGEQVAQLLGGEAQFVVGDMFAPFGWAASAPILLGGVFGVGALIIAGEAERDSFEAKDFVYLRELAGFAEVALQAWQTVEDCMTEVAVARLEAAQANGARHRFFAHLSHELRTPLNVIGGFSELMAREMYGPHSCDRYADYSRDILDSARRLTKMVECLLHAADANDALPAVGA